MSAAADFRYLLLHANVALMRAPLDDPIMSGLVDQADEIDELAKRSPGFIGQPTPTDEGAVFKDESLLNVSLWQSVEDLDRFTHSGKHAGLLERRAEWFQPQTSPNYVLYWVPLGQIPTETEIAERLEHLSRNGPTPYAFTFQDRFTVSEMLSFQEESFT